MGLRTYFWSGRFVPTLAKVTLTLYLGGMITMPKGHRIGAVCWDGSMSYSTGSGTCSHHGGVREWLYSESQLPLSFLSKPLLYCGHTSVVMLVVSILLIRRRNKRLAANRSRK